MIVDIVVAGLGTEHSNYYNNFLKSISSQRHHIMYHHPTYTANDVVNLVITNMRLDKQRFGSLSFRMFGFSLGCMTLMRVLGNSKIRSFNVKNVFLINPSDIQTDRDNESYYRYVFGIPKCLRPMFFKCYGRLVSAPNEEPENHMRHLMSKKFKFWKTIVDTEANSESWHVSTTRCLLNDRINVVVGTKDRYNPFAESLVSKYPQRYVKLDVPDGRHHMIYNRYDQVAQVVLRVFDPSTIFE